MKLFSYKLAALLVLGTFASSCTNNESSVTKTSETPKELQSLSWLVGDWKDDESGLDVTLDWKWDHNRKFLLQEFEMKEEDDNTLTGTQILGWDPIEKTVRSWTFDSDGGFGDSRWEESENVWYVQASYVTAAGEKASATYIYKKIDDKTFTFTSEVREINGELLPDAGPFTFVRR